VINCVSEITKHPIGYSVATTFSKVAILRPVTSFLDHRVARAYPLTDLVKLVRTYGVLAGTCDSERIIVGELSRRWIATEVEHHVPLSSLPPALFETLRGRDLLAAELFENQDIDPETIRPSELDIQTLGQDRLINTNRLPKLEPIIHGAVLAANILLGVRLYGAHGKGMPSMSHDLIVATMLQDTLGKQSRYSSVSAIDHEIVDDTYIFTWFGDAVAGLVRELNDYLKAFSDAVDAGVPVPEPPSPEIATAVAAVHASHLRLTARAAGDKVISFLTKEGVAELEAIGVDCNSDFPERPFLQSDYTRTLIAFGLPGVDHYALREPLRSTLMTAVRDALEDPVKCERLSGRRGKATHEVHMNLPVMEYFVASESPNSIETVHLASLEMMRSLEKGRRKSLSSMSAHAFRISAIAERVLGRALEPVIVTLAMLHDVVEDGSLRVTGYGHSLRKIQFRFGGPIAAMVSELTDSNVLTAGASKADVTLKHPHMLLPQAQYNVARFTQMNLSPTEAEEPYTLAGIVIKLLDTVVSLEEGIRDPELMDGYWKHSGARIYWAERSRGLIVNPLVERMRIEIKASQADPEYMTRPQNLAILSHEYGLDESEREQLIRLFNDQNVDEAHFREHALDTLLDDRRLVESLKSGRLPHRGYTTLYALDADDAAPRDESTFLRYRKSALRRQRIRRDLGLDSAAKLAALDLRQEFVLRVFDRTMQNLTEHSARSLDGLEATGS